MVGDDLGTAKQPEEINFYGPIFSLDQSKHPISIGQAVSEPSKVKNAKEKIEFSLLLVSNLHKCFETETALLKLAEAMYLLSKYEENI